jgi:hypothetical protein
MPRQRALRADHRGTRTGTMRSAPEQFCFYANVEIQPISAFFKAIQSYSKLFKAIQAYSRKK